MPFYEGDENSPQLKENVTLTQLHVPPPNQKKGKTYFTNVTTFWFAPNQSTTALSFETVPAAQVTDLASVPRFMWGVVASYGRHTLPAILHDQGCDVAGKLKRKRHRLRRHVDHRFRKNLASFAHMGVATRWMMWSAVRIFGVRWIAVLTLAGVVCGYGAAAAALWSDPEITSIPWIHWTHWPVHSHVHAAWLRDAAVVLACALVVFVVVVSFEVKEAKVPPEGTRSFRVTAFVSMVGAVLLGSVLALPLAPLIAITVITNLIIFLVNFGWWLVVQGAHAVVTSFTSEAFAQAQLPGLHAAAEHSRPPFALFPGP